jgi:hypothetical protein
MPKSITSATNHGPNLQYPFTCETGSESAILDRFYIFIGDRWRNLDLPGFEQDGDAWVHHYY